MPTGIYLRKPISEETRRKMSLSQRGRTLTSEHCKKLSEAHKGIKLSPYHRLKIGLGGRGILKPFSKQHKKNLSIAHIGLQAKEKHPNWKNGITSENNLIRNGIEAKLWKQSVFARDGYTCQKTGIKGGKLVAHHILNFSSHTELRFAIDNGITLSEKSHRAFHKIYGIKNNSREQLLEYLNNI